MSTTAAPSPDPAAETYDFKVVVAGPFASGKTTFIDAISDIPVVGTEAPTAGAEAVVKATTTVGMEYGTFATSGDGLTACLYLFGVPGQTRFSFMWDIVGEGMDALLIMVDASDPQTWDEAADVARHFGERYPTPTVVAANRSDDEQVPDELRSRVAVPGAEYVTCDVRSRESARSVLVELLLLLLDSLPPDEADEAAALAS